MFMFNRYERPRVNPKDGYGVNWGEHERAPH